MPSQDQTTALVAGGVGVVAVAMTAWWLATPKKPEPSPGKTALIVGGGIAGLSAAHALRQLDAQVKIVLVDPKDYCEILWASYRSPFEDWVAKGSLIQLDKYCQAYNVTHIQATVKRLNKASAVLDNGTSVKFDVCTIATGADAHWPGMGRGLPLTQQASTAEHRLTAMKAEGERLLSATSIAIIGGGLIGTELAGDIAGYSRKKQAGNHNYTPPQVMLIHSGPQLCPIMSPAAAKKVQQMLESLDVKIILNEKATEKGDGQKIVLQTSHQEIEAEIVIKTIGFKPMNETFMKASFPWALNERGWITTDEYLCVAGSDGKIFAFGDCSPSLPNAANVYMRTSHILGHNLKASLLNQLTTDMKKYVVPFAGLCNTAGPDRGVFYSSAFWTTHLLPWVKNRTMFFMSPRDTIGVRKEFTLAD